MPESAKSQRSQKKPGRLSGPGLGSTADFFGPDELNGSAVPVT